MKLKILFIAGLVALGLVLVSMTLTSVIDEVEVYDSSIPSTTTYTVEQNLPEAGSVTILGTRDVPPTPNSDGGHNYHCIKSSGTCYTCNKCEVTELVIH